jgi:DNA topoisomerase IA
MKNLVIVESPAKGKTIEKFLGKDFSVKASMGHIRDLEKKNLGIDIAAGFVPTYIVSEEKKKTVSELKKLVKEAEKVWIATDEDREGEAIGWHLCEALGLDSASVARIVFHEITKTAIENAVKNPRKIDMRLVNAQQSRRVLDRLVGFQISPVLWTKIRQGLSAGRVQSVAVKLIVEREREIRAFVPEEGWKLKIRLATPEGTLLRYRTRQAQGEKFPTEKSGRSLRNPFETRRQTLPEPKKKRIKRETRSFEIPLSTGFVFEGIRKEGRHSRSRSSVYYVHPPTGSVAQARNIGRGRL